jgi:adenylate cyclase
MPPLMRITTALGVGGLVSILGVAVFLSPVGLLMERSIGLPWLFALRGPLEPPAHVAVISINGETGADLNLPALPRDWPRSIHARLIRKLTEMNAAVIVFDIHFSREKDSATDRALVNAVEEAQRVVLFERLTGKTQPVIDVAGNKVGEIWSESLVPPFPALAEAASLLGVFPLPKIDAAVHEFWTFKDSVSFEPSMPAAALQLYAEQRAPDWSQQMSLSLLDETSDPGARMRALRRAYLTRETHQGTQPGTDPLINKLEALYSGAEHRYLNFYGPPGTIQNIPFQRIVEADVNTLPDLSNTVVFVGYSDLYDPGQLDRFYTVYTRDDGVDLAGVEIAATAFANLLQDSTLKPLTLAETAFLLIAIALFFSLAAYLLPAVLGVSLVVIGWVAYAVTAQWLFADSQWLPLTVPLLVQVPAALFLGILGQYRFERARGQRISEAINYYLPDHIAKEFAAGKMNPETSNNVSYGTCFATDMAGFSSIAQNMSPGDLAKFLNEYFEVLAKALNAHQVDVTEFRADAIMCAWIGAEGEVLQPRLSMRAALQAREAIGSFGQIHGMPKDSLRVGLEAGWFYVGHAGGGGHFVYSIVGDCANTASRLEGLNKYLGTQIIASKEVIEGVDDFFYRPLGLFQLKGKDEATEVYEVLGERREGSTEPTRLAPFTIALEAFQGHDLLMAKQGFENVLERWPEDGPAKFFLELCHEGLSNTSTDTDTLSPRIVRMDDK